MTDIDLEKVPAEQVGSVVQSFVSNDGATKIVCTRQSDGTWTVTAET